MWRFWTSLERSDAGRLQISLMRCGEVVDTFIEVCCGEVVEEFREVECPTSPVTL